MALAALTVACASESNVAGGADTPGPAVPAIQSQLLADTLARVCPGAQRGSVLVARPDPREEESQVSFQLLGDGAGPGVVLCRDVLYAAADTLLTLMGESGTVALRDGRAVIDGRATEIQAYLHEGVPYLALAPFARSRQALLVQRTEHRMDATLWPSCSPLRATPGGGSIRHTL